MIKALCIGFGSSGRRYLKNLKENKDIEIYVGRRNLSKPFSPDLNIFENYKFISYKQIEENGPYDLGLITTPSSLHLESLNFILPYVKDSILIEKPIITSKKDLKKIKKICNNIKVNLFTGFQYRHHDLVKEIKNLFVKNTFGEFVEAYFMHSEDVRNWHPWENYENSYSVRKELGGGAKNTLCHDLDTVLYLFGKPKNFKTYSGKASYEIDLKTDTNDWHNCLLLYEENHQIKPICINSSYNSRKNIHKFIIHLQKASLFGDFNTGCLNIFSENDNLISSKKYYSTKDDCYKRIIDEIFNLDLINKKNILSLDDLDFVTNLIFN